MRTNGIATAACALVALLAVSLPAPAQADTIAFQFSAPPTVFTPAVTQTRGLEFSTATPINITALGLWDEGGDGFSNSHKIGLWSMASTLLVSINMAAGTSASFYGGDEFRFVTLPNQYLLSAGTYRIGAYYVVGDADEIARDTPISAPGLAYAGPRLSTNGLFSDPTAASLAAGGSFSANFTFNPVGVPVPNSASLALIPLALLFIRRLRRA
jgi:hypothetical protein